MTTIHCNTDFENVKKAYEEGHEISAVLENGGYIVVDKATWKILIRTRYPEGRSVKVTGGDLDDVADMIRKAKSDGKVHIRKISEKEYEVCGVRIRRRTRR